MSNCMNCGVSFSVEPEELSWLKENGKDLPTFCPRCRAFTDGIQDESLTCTVCGRIFIHPRELRLFGRLFNWPRPKRCLGGCKKQGPPMTEQEQQIADFLRRLRLAAMANAALRGGIHHAQPTHSLRMSSMKADRGSSAPPEGVGGSLAQALKEFQERKRRKGP
jgi:hypothetical protein